MPAAIPWQVPPNVQAPPQALGFQVQATLGSLLQVPWQQMGGRFYRVEVQPRAPAAR